MQPTFERRPSASSASSSTASARWGRLVGDVDRARGRDRARRGRGALPRAGRADEDPRRPPHVPLAASRSTRRARRPSRRTSSSRRRRSTATGGPIRMAQRRAVPQLRGRARGRRRPADEGRAARRRPRPRRGLHVRERRRDARLPARRPRLDAPREGAGRLSPTRAGARARPGSSTRPTSRSART